MVSSHSEPRAATSASSCAFTLWCFSSVVTVSFAAMLKAPSLRRMWINGVHLRSKSFPRGNPYSKFKKCFHPQINPYFLLFHQFLCLYKFLPHKSLSTPRWGGGGHGTSLMTGNQVHGSIDGPTM